MRSGCTFGQVIENDDHEVFYIPTTALGPIRHLQVMSNIVRRWRREMGFGPEYIPGSIYRRMHEEGWSIEKRQIDPGVEYDIDAIILIL
jgi:hypothetical protein